VVHKDINSAIEYFTPCILLCQQTSYLFGIWRMLSVLRMSRIWMPRIWMLWKEWRMLCRSRNCVSNSTMAKYMPSYS